MSCMTHHILGNLQLRPSTHHHIGKSYHFVVTHCPYMRSTNLPLYRNMLSSRHHKQLMNSFEGLWRSRWNTHMWKEQWNFQALRGQSTAGKNSRQSPDKTCTKDDKIHNLTHLHSQHKTTHYIHTPSFG